MLGLATLVDTEFSVLYTKGLRQTIGWAVPSTSHTSALIFVLTLCGTFGASWLGRHHTPPSAGHGLSDQRLNRWLVGLSGGAAATSGFVLTGLVGLGYAFGLSGLHYTIGWLLGDMLFWWVFPQRINRVARETSAATVTDIVTSGLSPHAHKVTKRAIGILIVVCLAGYVSAQWLAGEKFLQGAFGFGAKTSLPAFAALIIVYTTLGGFRGSIYTDALQAGIRIVATAIVMAALYFAAKSLGAEFWRRLSLAGPDYLNLVPGGWGSTALIVLGWAASCIGFGLGQPHMVTRYMAGDTPSETRAAWWIYIGFVQYTQIAMTLFGVFVRGVLPDLTDPEEGLSVFFHSFAGPLLTGILVADIFSTIAATSNSILIAIAQTAAYDLLLKPSRNQDPKTLWPMTVIAGLVTMAITSMMHAKISSIVLSMVSLVGAGVAPAMIARVFEWRRSDLSVIASVVSGVAVALLWKAGGLGDAFNEAGPGMIAGLLVGQTVAALQSRATSGAADPAEAQKRSMSSGE